MRWCRATRSSAASARWARASRGLAVGQRVGVPWLGWTCGRCEHCLAGRENLCPKAEFTGWQRDGGYAEQVLADARYVFAIPSGYSDAQAAPLLCAGLIGWRAYAMAGPGARRIGLYGFGAAAHLIAQVAVHQGREVFAFTRPGDSAAQALARSLGAVWAGESGQAPPQPLDAALLFAPVGALVPTALQAVRPGGTVVCAGIHMSDIPSFPVRLAVGRAAHRLGGQSDAPGRRRFHARGGLDAAAGQHPQLPAGRRPTRPWTTCAPAALPVRRCCSCRSAQGADTESRSIA